MGILFDGNDWIVSTVNYNRASTDHTVMYWARLDNNAAIRRSFGNTTNWECRTGNPTNNTLQGEYLAGTGGRSNLLLVTGTYHHVAFVVDVTNAKRIPYLDGVAQTTIDPAGFAGEQNNKLRLGVTPGGGGAQGWVGALDDVRVYDRVVSAAEIQTIHATRGLDGIRESLALWYRLDEGVEGATVDVALVSSGTEGPDLVTVNGDPKFDYSAGIKYRRNV